MPWLAHQSPQRQMHDQGFLLLLYCSVKFHVHFHPSSLSLISAGAAALVADAGIIRQRKERRVHRVRCIWKHALRSSGPTKKQGHVQGKGKGREDTLLGAAVWCFLPPFFMYTSFSPSFSSSFLFFFYFFIPTPTVSCNRSQSRPSIYRLTRHQGGYVFSKPALITRSKRNSSIQRPSQVTCPQPSLVCVGVLYLSYLLRLDK